MFYKIKLKELLYKTIYPFIEWENGGVIWQTSDPFALYGMWGSRKTSRDVPTNKKPVTPYNSKTAICIINKVPCCAATLWSNLAAKVLFRTGLVGLSSAATKSKKQN